MTATRLVGSVDLDVQDAARWRRPGLIVAASLQVMLGVACVSDEPPAQEATAVAEVSACTRASSPVRLSSTARARTYRYTETVRPVTFTEVRIDTTSYANFIAFLEEFNETADVDVFDQVALLERQRDVFIRFLGPEAGEMHQKILDGEVGTLGNVTCLQSILFDLQNADWPLSAGPVEMGAYVLERTVGSNVQLRVYAKTQAQGGVTGISMAELDSRLTADLRAGWSFRAHLHSHPLSPDNPLDYAGTVIPSSADANTYRNLRNNRGLQEAWIINGVHAARYLASEFDAIE